ncbi:hypothetical protein KKG71_01450 [Patescibacteria group bacterium]|nr:hypothetical protein [Patescibacteria group bacterium]
MARHESWRQKLNSIMKKHPGYSPSSKQKTIIKAYHRLYKKFTRNYESSWDEPKFKDISFKKRLAKKDSKYTVEFQRYKYSENRTGAENREYVDILPKAIHNYLETIIYKNSKIEESKKEELIQLHSFKILKTLALAGINVNQVEEGEQIEIKNGILKIRDNYYSLNTGLGIKLEKKFKKEKKKIIKTAKKQVNTEKKKKEESDKQKKKRDNLHRKLEKEKLEREKEKKHKLKDELDKKKAEYEKKRQRLKETADRKRKEKEIERKKAEAERKRKAVLERKKIEAAEKLKQEKEKKLKLKDELDKKTLEAKKKRLKQEAERKQKADLERKKIEAAEKLKQEKELKRKKEQEQKKAAAEKELNDLENALKQNPDDKKYIEERIQEKKQQLEELVKQQLEEDKKQAEKKHKEEKERKEQAQKAAEKQAAEEKKKIADAKHEKEERRKKILSSGLLGLNLNLGGPLDKSIPKGSMKTGKAATESSNLSSSKQPIMPPEINVMDRGLLTTGTDKILDKLGLKKEVPNAKMQSPSATNRRNPISISELNKGFEKEEAANAAAKKAAMAKKREEQARKKAEAEKKRIATEKLRQENMRKKILGMGLLSLTMASLLKKENIKIPKSTMQRGQNPSNSKQPIPLEEIFPPQKKKKITPKKTEKQKNKPELKQVDKTKSKTDKKSQKTQIGSVKYEIISGNLSRIDINNPHIIALIESITKPKELLLRYFLNDQEIVNLKKALISATKEHFKNKSPNKEEFTKAMNHYWLKIAYPLNDIATAITNFTHLKYLKFGRGILYAFEIENKRNKRASYFHEKNLKISSFKNFLQTSKPDHSKFYNALFDYLKEHQKIHLFIKKMQSYQTLTDTLTPQNKKISLQYHFNHRAIKTKPHIIIYQHASGKYNIFEMYITSETLNDMQNEMKQAFTKLNTILTIKQTLNKTFNGGIDIESPLIFDKRDAIITATIETKGQRAMFNFYINIYSGRIEKIRQISPTKSEIIDLSKTDSRLANAIRTIHLHNSSKALHELKKIFRSLEG